jgi:hypothetical protein
MKLRCWSINLKAEKKENKMICQNEINKLEQYQLELNNIYSEDEQYWQQHSRLK